MPISTSPVPVDTERMPSAWADVDVTGAALDAQLGAGPLESDVAGAGLDGQRAVEDVEPAVAGAALDLAVAERAVEGDVGAAGLDGRVAVVGERDVTAYDGSLPKKLRCPSGAITLIWLPS